MKTRTVLAKPERAGCCKHKEAKWLGLSGLQQGTDAQRGCDCSPGPLGLGSHSITDPATHHCRGFSLPFGGWDVQDQGPGSLGARTGLLPGSQTQSSCGARGEGGLRVFIRHYSHNCPSGAVGKESACNAGDPCSIPGSGRSPTEGNDNPLQYSCLGKSHGQRSLVGYSLWDLKESTQLSHSLSLS